MRQILNLQEKISVNELKKHLHPSPSSKSSAQFCYCKVGNLLSGSSERRPFDELRKISHCYLDLVLEK